MFIWWDKKVNPCDVDYKSYLQLGTFKDNLSDVWNSKNYNKLREDHLKKKRNNHNPCRSCVVV